MNIIDSLTPINHTEGRGGHTVRAACLHVTDGESAMSAVNWFKNPASQVSAHYVYDGVARLFYRVVDEADTAWANGVINQPNMNRAVVARWVNGNINPNKETVSIEKAGMASAGWKDHEVEDVRLLVRDICGRHGLTPGVETVIGHKDIDSINRARCPSLTPAQWARMWSVPPVTVPDEDAKLEAEYQRNRVRLGYKRFKATIDRPYYRGAVLVCQRGWVGVDPATTVTIDQGGMDDLITYLEQSGVMTRVGG